MLHRVARLGDEKQKSDFTTDDKVACACTKKNLKGGLKGNLKGGLKGKL